MMFVQTRHARSVTLHSSREASNYLLPPPYWFVEPIVRGMVYASAASYCRLAALHCVDSDSARAVNDDRGHLCSNLPVYKSVFISFSFSFFLSSSSSRNQDSLPFHPHPHLDFHPNLHLSGRYLPIYQTLITMKISTIGE